LTIKEQSLSPELVNFGLQKHSNNSCWLEKIRNGKNQNSTFLHSDFMEIWFLPVEAVFLTFQLANVSGWLTSHRLIIVEHQPGKLNKGKRKDYPLRNF